MSVRERNWALFWGFFSFREKNGFFGLRSDVTKGPNVSGVLVLSFQNKTYETFLFRCLHCLWKKERRAKLKKKKTLFVPCGEIVHTSNNSYR